MGVYFYGLLMTSRLHGNRTHLDSTRVLADNEIITLSNLRGAWKAFEYTAFTDRDWM